jgi:hypothetical protein
MHRANPADDLQGLLHIAYGFHVPLMISAVILAYSFLSLARSRRSEEPAAADLKANSEVPWLLNSPVA